MSEEEMNEFLGRGGTGVISFSTDPDEPPVSIPISYGYSADVKHFYYRLSVPQDSRKEDLVDRPVSFVTHGETDSGWRSIVVTGRLRALRVSRNTGNVGDSNPARRHFRTAAERNDVPVFQSRSRNDDGTERDEG